MLRTFAAFIALWVALPAFAGEVLVDFLDVGQGDGILIRGGGKNVLIDAGIKSARVAEQLQVLGVERLDLVVTTHPHADHMGGMEDVVRGFPIGLYLDNGMPHTTETYASLMRAIEELQVPYRTAQFGMTLNLGTEAVFTVLMPDVTPITGTRSDLNSNSVVLLLSHDDVDFLFTGDAEEPTEQVLGRRELPSIELLKVAHHGGGHSSTSGFLQRVRPTYAVISCGVGNRYGHPDPEAIDRLTASGAQIYRTDISGHLRAVSNGRVVEILEGAVPELERFRQQDDDPRPTSVIASSEAIRDRLEATGRGTTPRPPSGTPAPTSVTPAATVPTPPTSTPPASVAVAPTTGTPRAASTPSGRGRRHDETAPTSEIVPVAPVPAPASAALDLSGVRPGTIPVEEEGTGRKRRKKKD